MLMTSYGSLRGGMATPVGTPPNLIAIGMLDQQLGIRITFVEWMLVAVPVTIVLMGVVFGYFNWVGRTGIREIPGADRIIAERRRALGPWKPGERNAVIAFGVTVSLWIIPGMLPLLLGRDHPVAAAVLASVPEAVAALVGVAVLFLLPVSATQRSTITWKEAAQIDWGTILLFGGGLALGTLSASTGLAQVVGEGITGLVPAERVALTFAAALFTVLLSETMSNTRGDQHLRADHHLRRAGGGRRPRGPGRRGRPVGLGGRHAAGFHPPERDRIRVGQDPHHEHDQVRHPHGHRGRDHGADDGAAADVRAGRRSASRTGGAGRTRPRGRHPNAGVRPRGQLPGGEGCSHAEGW